MTRPLALFLAVAIGLPAGAATSSSQQPQPTAKDAPRLTPEQLKALADQQAEAEKKSEELKRQLQLQQQLQAQQPAQQQQSSTEEKQKEEEKKEEPKKESKADPKLDLPIGWFVFGAVLGGLGALTGILSAGPERDLRNPAMHVNPTDTRILYWRAYYGGFVSKGFYSLSGAAAGMASYKTQSAVRGYLTAKAGLAAAEKEQDEAHAQAIAEASGTVIEPARSKDTSSLRLVAASPFGLVVEF